MHWPKLIFGIALVFSGQLALPDTQDLSLGKLTYAPGIVLVYKMKDIYALGLDRVINSLRFSPGFIVQDVAIGSCVLNQTMQQHTGYLAQPDYALHVDARATALICSGYLG